MSHPGDGGRFPPSGLSLEDGDGGAVLSREGANRLWTVRPLTAVLPAREAAPNGLGEPGGPEHPHDERDEPLHCGQLDGADEAPDEDGQHPRAEEEQEHSGHLSSYHTACRSEVVVNDTACGAAPPVLCGRVKRAMRRVMFERSMSESNRLSGHPG